MVPSLIPAIQEVKIGKIFAFRPALAKKVKTPPSQQNKLCEVSQLCNPRNMEGHR
jgi:hypothetical protein